MNSLHDGAESAKRAIMRSFLRALWPENQERGALGAWTLPDAECRWFPLDEAGIESAIDYAVSIQREREVYFHVASHDPAFVRKGGRGRIDTAIALPCLWADADFFKTGRAKVYPTREQLDRALAAMRLKPSIIVFTGGGYHVYWLLQEPVRANHRTKRLCKLWQLYLKLTHGKAMDSTADAARILRLPGTRNQKRGEIVQLVEFSPDRRYLLEDFEGVLEELGVADTATSTNDGTESVVQNKVLVLAKGMDSTWSFKRFAAESINRTQPSGPGEHYDCIWALVRLLASHPHYANQTIATFRGIVGEWRARALPYIANKNLSESWRLFCGGRRDLKWPAGCGLREAMLYARARVTRPVIDLCRQYRLRSKKFPQVVVLCIRLQQIRGDQPFFLSSYDVAPWLEVAPTTGWGYLAKLVERGLLKKVKVGRRIDGLSNEYQWLGPSADELGIVNH